MTRAWRAAAYGAALSTGWWLGRRWGRTHGSTEQAAATPSQPAAERFTGATASVGNGEVRAGDVAWAAAASSGPSPELLAGGLITARSVARLKALRATANSLASLGTDLVEEGAEDAGLPTLEAAAYCLDAVGHLEASRG